MTPHPPPQEQGSPAPRERTAPLISPLYFLLAAIPVVLALWYFKVNGVWVFLASGVAIIPLAALMGRATEALADRLGPGVGGLLNATFGNAAELIIALLALMNGKGELVKASITGSIIGNVLLVLGLSTLLGGLFHQRQTFNRTAASLGTTLLALACVGLIIPAISFYLQPPERRQAVEYAISDEIAVILAVTYLLSLMFSLWTHRHLFAGPEAQEEQRTEPEWSVSKAILVLLAATAGIALMSEFLVGSVEQAAHSFGVTDLFIGVIVVAIVGNAAEHSTAVLAAMKNKMDLAVTIAVGSSFQVALFVAPVLVGASYLIGPRPLDLHFTPLEVVAVVLAIGILALVSQDGESHWMEGALLLAVYLILALAFYHAAPAAPSSLQR